MMHPNVATIDKTAAGATKTLLAQTPAVGALGRTITGMQDRGRNFGSLVQATDADGNPAQITVGDTTTTFKTFQFSSDPDFRQGLKSAVSAAVTGVRDTGSLGAVIDQPLELQPAAATKTWVQSQGVAPQPRPYADAALLGSGLSIQVKNTGDVFGTKTVVNGGYSNGQVPLTLYNNWVRWIWVYVQYLGPGDANLSANPNASFPDTKYSQSVGLLSQVNTILGVPLWGTNSINVTLDYPEGAHTARLLFCGLGSDLSGGGWRQYFPADAYPGKIAPQDEVLVPALLTGILTIGLTVFSLVTDLNAATAFIAIKEPTSELAKAGVAIFDAILALGLPVGEAVAVDVAAGNASAAVNGPNIFNLLLPLAAGIPKVLFTPEKAPAWGRIGAAVAGVEGESAVLAAIPVIGEVLEVIDVLGDVATLAEECAETIVAPWVIENEVNLTYPATVTVSIDRSQASTFPVTAVSWSLEAKVDGAVTLDPITGSINDGGRIRSDPLVLSVTAPFGGQQIQWSIVFLDSAGRQVGTGVSAGAANDDPSESAVVRLDHDPADPGHDHLRDAVQARRTPRATAPRRAATPGRTRSRTAARSPTRGSRRWPAPSISTLAGVAGVVWEQDDRFYLRGVPVAENGDTIALGPATAQGYARRPFLLLDPFVERGAQGNHVLLEPDPETPEYHVRQVALDATTGAPTWDSSVSWGTFPLPISAAALHSSGRVVAVNTDNGRVGTLQPAGAAPPPQAAYTAGPGTQVGLLSSPVAVAVTNPGIVLVLEAAALQIAAFDLNGDPVPYFTGATASLTRRALATRARGAQATAQYTLPLATAGSYLDLAVDGAGQIYVLYYTGDGSAPSDYRIDVYAQTGALLDNASPGVNVPHFAVDYWRSIYAANYDPLADTVSGQPRIDPALGVAEPSLSRFDPTVGASLTRLRRRKRARARR